MACSTSSSSFFYIFTPTLIRSTTLQVQAQSQPRRNINTQKPRSTSKRSPKPPRRNPNPTPQFTTYRTGCEATTYTRLPPIDEAPFQSLNLISNEVKLIELIEDNDTNPNVSFSDDEQVEVIKWNSSFEEEDVDEGNVLRVEENEENSDADADADDDEDKKEKGVPAVMRCFDRAKIFVKAGDGGNGVVAFRREKYVPYGGPSGGCGGRGGNVYVEVDGSMNSLLSFRKNIHFRAGRGSHGQGKQMDGAKGEDIVVKVAPGTLVREAHQEGNEGNVLFELLHPGQRALLLPGGRGGRGNASFKSGTNKVPKIAENGEAGLEM